MTSEGIYQRHKSLRSLPAERIRREHRRRLGERKWYGQDARLILPASTSARHVIMPAGSAVNMASETGAPPFGSPDFARK